MKYNRSEVMKEAWKRFKAHQENLKFDRFASLKPALTFGHFLAVAWSYAKAEKSTQNPATPQEATTELEKVERQIFILNMKDRWSNEDHEYSRELNAKRIKLSKEAA